MVQGTRRGGRRHYGMLAPGPDAPEELYVPMLNLSFGEIPDGSAVAGE